MVERVEKTAEHIDLHCLREQDRKDRKKEKHPDTEIKVRKREIKAQKKAMSIVASFHPVNVDEPIKER